ncbi:MAG: hypothetical protein U9O24_02390, partial [Campylobacterota bacterium]|nr:hypothetical protein [Campylobacterota bacterium]
LGGKVGSTFDKQEIKKLLANLKKRTFFLKSAHLDDIRLFTTRWVISYLKGPLKRAEISKLMESKKTIVDKEKNINPFASDSTSLDVYQNIDTSIPQYFEIDPSGKNQFVATLGVKAKIHFYDKRKNIDEEREVRLSLMLEPELQRIEWGDAREDNTAFEKFPFTSPSKAGFQVLPEVVGEDKGLKKAIKLLKEELYREEQIELFRSLSPKLESRVDETRSNFLVRVKDMLNEKKELEIEKLQIRYGKKEKTLLTRLLRAKERVKKESSDSTSSMIETGIAVLGALFGKASPTKISSALRKGNKVLKERGDMSRAEERMAELEDDIEALEYELEDKIDILDEKYNIDNCEVENFSIKPRKKDIDVELCAVVWKVS